MPLHLSHNTDRRCRRAGWRVALSGVILLGALAASGARAQDAGGEKVTPATRHAQDAGDAKVRPATRNAQDQNAPAQAAAPQTQTPPPAAPGINFRERPKYAADPQRLRRSPQIDGVINDGEWDTFYTVADGPIKGTVYCNWDDNFLYVAARTDQAAMLVIDVDATDDGWLRGADNLELVIGSPADNGAPTVAARLLDAANPKDAPTWNDKALDIKSIQVAYKPANGAQMVEVAIPKNMGSLVLRSGASIGLRVEFLPLAPAASYTPTAPFEPHLLLDAKLVEARVQGVPGINPRLTLSDYKCVAGQKLFATLDLLNQTDVTVPIQSILWTGEGASVNAVDTIRQLTVPPIPASKHLKLGYKTLLPQSLTPGSYTLTVTADLGPNKQVQSTATFTIVEPIQPQMSSEPSPLVIVGSTKLELLVDVYSAVPDHFRGELELTNFPQGWELEGNRRRTLVVVGEDARSVTRVRFKLPSSTLAGDYPVDAQINWYNRVWKLHTVVHVQRTEAPPAETKPADKSGQ
jgi:hypothetical protein